LKSRTDGREQHCTVGCTVGWKELSSVQTVGILGC
jgi:hypothetical protein